MRLKGKMNCLRGLYPAEEFILGESATGPFILATMELFEVFGEFLLKCSLMKSSQTCELCKDGGYIFWML